MTTTSRRRPALPIALGAAFLVLLGACNRGRETVQPPGTATPGSLAGGTLPKTTVRPAVTTGAIATTDSLTTADGRERSYHVYVPPSLKQDTPVPLLIVMHGGTGWGQQYERNSGFDGLAEANGFIVVYPDGIEIGPLFPRGRVWNGGDCCGPASKQEVDDVAFISQLIDKLESANNIDKNRVFAAGHSNGGIMAYRLACELSDKVVGIGLQAGWLAIPKDDCRPSHPVSMIHIHGTADQNAPIDGGKGDRSISGTDATPAAANVKLIADRDGCPTPPESTDRGDIHTELWSPCDGQSAVEFVKVNGANHAWMGHEGNPISERVVGDPYLGLDSSAEIWAFLTAHPRHG